MRSVKEVLRKFFGPEKVDPAVVKRLENVENRIDEIDDVLGIDSAARAAAEVELERSRRGGE